MKEPNLQITTLLSLLLHVTFLFVALLIMKQSNHFVMPSSYIVSLVSTEVADTGAPGKGAATVSEEESAPPMSLPSKTSKKLKPADDTKQYAENRIAAMEATRKAKNILRLRNVISIGGSGSSQTGTDDAEPAQSTTGDASSDTILSSYTAGIQRRIEQHWAFPTTWGKNLQARISILVMSDGTAKVNRIEKGSGNIFFDRSVISAIYKASPFPPPPYEMEIELNFQPKDKN